MSPLPTVLQISNDGDGGVRVCVTGCLAAVAGPRAGERECSQAGPDEVGPDD